MIKCGDCVHYKAMVKRHKSGAVRNLSHGHCLAKSKYSKHNKAYSAPMGAKMHDGETNKHRLLIVAYSDIQPKCTYTKERTDDK